MNNHLNQGLLTFPVTSDSVLAEKKKYRREAFLRWKNKRRKIDSFCPLSESSATFTINYISVLAEKKNYRREAFLRWKNKRRKNDSTCPLSESSGPFTINDDILFFKITYVNVFLLMLFLFQVSF